jgi:spermidine synthase
LTGITATSERRVRSAASTRLLLGSVVVVATSGMMYELVAGTVAGYFLGNAVTQFAIVLGVYLSAMGAGASLSARFGGNLTARFVEVETLVALIGGTSAATWFYAFAHVSAFRPVLYGEVAVIGLLIGIELPLLLRLLRESLGFDESIVQGLTFDYVGSLAASILFPLVLMPMLGLIRAAAASGLVNAAIAFLGAKLIVPEAKRRARRVGSVVVACVLMGVVAYGADIAHATAD